MMGGAAAGPSPAQPLNKRPRGGMTGGGIRRSGVEPSAGDSYPAPRLNRQPRGRGGMMGGGMGGGGFGGGFGGGGFGGGMGGGMMMEGIGLPEEPVVDHDSMMHESALPEIISDEVRKELQRILPILLREMLPKLLKETEIGAVNDPGTTR